MSSVMRGLFANTFAIYRHWIGGNACIAALDSPMDVKQPLIFTSLPEDGGYFERWTRSLLSHFNCTISAPKQTNSEEGTKKGTEHLFELREEDSLALRLLNRECVNVQDFEALSRQQHQPCYVVLYADAASLLESCFSLRHCGYCNVPNYALLDILFSPDYGTFTQLRPFMQTEAPFVVLDRWDDLTPEEQEDLWRELLEYLPPVRVICLSYTAHGRWTAMTLEKVLSMLYTAGIQ